MERTNKNKNKDLWLNEWQPERNLIVMHIKKENVVYERTEKRSSLTKMFRVDQVNVGVNGSSEKIEIFSKTSHSIVQRFTVLTITRYVCVPVLCRSTSPPW